MEPARMARVLDLPGLMMSTRIPPRGIIRAAEVPKPTAPVAQPIVRGMTGARVTALQQKLVAAGFMTSDDYRSGPGVFGPRTQNAVLRLQANAGLPETGVADEKTLAALSRGARFNRPLPSLDSGDEATQPMGHAIKK
jgi:peptidoglycan hydrolase-like protein with peptidoglycan-binding domain